MVQANTLAISNDRIVAFKTSHKAEMFCFATIESVVIMDSKRLDSPVVVWMHGLKDGLPSTLFLEDVSNQNCKCFLPRDKKKGESLQELCIVKMVSIIRAHYGIFK